VTTLSVDDIAHLVVPRHFANAAVGIAIALAESGGKSDAVHHNAGPPPSIDRGLWQINSRFHPEVTDAQAFDPVAATDAARRISKAGTDWTPWAAFRNNAYARYLPAAQSAVARLAKPAWWAGWIRKVKPTIREGVRDWPVAYLQSVLFIRCAQTDVKVTGLFDAATDRAVRNIQAFFHLTVDGIVGSRQTWPIIDFLAAT